jgi:hypothetical protein
MDDKVLKIGNMQFWSPIFLGICSIRIMNTVMVWLYTWNSYSVVCLHFHYNE